jgi:hypothetical protein
MHRVVHNVIPIQGMNQGTIGIQSVDHIWWFCVVHAEINQEA